MGKEENSGRIQVLERMAQILDLFSAERMEWRFRDIVAESGLNKSTVFNIVNTLRELNYLEQDEETKKYRLGRQLLRLGELSKKSVKITKIAQPYMLKIRDSFNETVQLARLDGSYTIYLEKVECSQSIQTYSMMGDAIPAYATGLGKAMLAYKDDSYIDRYFAAPLKQFTEHTLKSVEELKQALEVIRREGIACDNEEYSAGLICYACPIFDHEGKAVYAISVSTPRYRMNPKKETAIKAELKEKSLIISRHLGCQGV